MWLNREVLRGPLSLFSLLHLYLRWRGKENVRVILQERTETALPYWEVLSRGQGYENE